MIFNWVISWGHISKRKNETLFLKIHVFMWKLWIFSHSGSNSIPIVWSVAYPRRTVLQDWWADQHPCHSPWDHSWASLNVAPDSGLGESDIWHWVWHLTRHMKWRNHNMKWHLPWPLKFHLTWHIKWHLTCHWSWNHIKLHNQTICHALGHYIKLNVT